VGRLLGDPEIWDDSPPRPRPAVRRLAGLAAGAVAGLLLALAVVPRPAPPPPEVRLPTIRDGRVSAEGRGGAEHAVVGPTGSLHLPAHALDVLPPGARIVVEVEGDQAVLKPTDGEATP